jgi:hypothetical protein
VLSSEVDPCVLEPQVLTNCRDLPRQANRQCAFGLAICQADTEARVGIGQHEEGALN